MQTPHDLICFVLSCKISSAFAALLSWMDLREGKSSPLKLPGGVPKVRLITREVADTRAGLRPGSWP